MDKTITQAESQPIVLCKNCEHKMKGEMMYCSSCGQKVISKRLSTKTVLNDVFESITNVESGFWYSLKMLVLRPNEYLSGYLSGGTKKYTNVFRLIILLSAISLFLGNYFGLMEPMAKISATENDSAEMIKFIELLQNYSMYLTCLMIPFFALASLFVFRKMKLYYAEHLVLNSIWLSGYTLLSIFSLVFVPFIGQEHIVYYAGLSMILFLGYFVYANKMYFKFTWVKTFLLSLLHYVFGVALYSVFLLVILGLFDLVMN